jgi:hypothetical protein
VVTDTRCYLSPWDTNTLWVYTNLGRSCAVASLLLPELSVRSEENFFRGFRAPRPPGPYSQADRWGIYFFYSRLSFSYINVLPLLMLITSATHSPARRMRVREGGAAAYRGFTLEIRPPLASCAHTIRLASVPAYAV